MKAITQARTGSRKKDDEFTRLVTLIVQKDDFRDALRSDPATALQAQHFEVTDEITRALKRFDWRAAEQVALAFGWKRSGPLPPGMFT